MFSLPILANTQVVDPQAHGKIKSRFSLLAVAVVGSLSLIGCQKPAETAASTETTAETSTETTTEPAADGDTIKVGILHSLSGHL